MGVYLRLHLGTGDAHLFELLLDGLDFLGAGFERFDGCADFILGGNIGHSLGGVGHILEHFLHQGHIRVGIGSRRLFNFGGSGLFLRRGSRWECKNGEGRQ